MVCQHPTSLKQLVTYVAHFFTQLKSRDLKCIVTVRGVLKRSTNNDRIHNNLSNPQATLWSHALSNLLCFAGQFHRFVCHICLLKCYFFTYYSKCNILSIYILVYSMLLITKNKRAFHGPASFPYPSKSYLDINFLFLFKLSKIPLFLQYVTLGMFTALTFF